MLGIALITPEDWRAAANIEASLSQYLITVALAIMAAQAALAAIFVDKRTRLVHFYFTSLVALIALVISILYGGRGIATVYKQGFDGHWENNEIARNEFNSQAILLLVGFILAVIAVILGLVRGERIVETVPVSSRTIPPNQLGHPLPHARWLTMSQKTFSLTIGVLFLVMVSIHVLRVVFGWQVTISGRLIPIWTSWITLVVAAYLAYEGFRLARKPH